MSRMSQRNYWGCPTVDRDNSKDYWTVFHYNDEDVASEPDDVPYTAALARYTNANHPSRQINSTTSGRNFAYRVVSGLWVGHDGAFRDPLVIEEDIMRAIRRRLEALNLVRTWLLRTEGFEYELDMICALDTILEITGEFHCGVWREYEEAMGMLEEAGM